MSQRESKLSREIMTKLRLEGAFCFKVHGSEFMMAGLPDIIGVYRGYFFAFETKMPTDRGNTSPRQVRVHELIRAAGGLCRVICSAAEALRYLSEIDDAPAIEQWADD